MMSAIRNVEEATENGAATATALDKNDVDGNKAALNINRLKDGKICFLQGQVDRKKQLLLHAHQQHDELNRCLTLKDMEIAKLNGEVMELKNEVRENNGKIQLLQYRVQKLNKSQITGTPHKLDIREAWLVHWRKSNDIRQQIRANRTAEKILQKNNCGTKRTSESLKLNSGEARWLSDDGKRYVSRIEMNRSMASAATTESLSSSFSHSQDENSPPNLPNITEHPVDVTSQSIKKIFSGFMRTSSIVAASVHPRSSSHSSEVSRPHNKNSLGSINDSAVNNSRYDQEKRENHSSHHSNGQLHVNSYNQQKYHSRSAAYIVDTLNSPKTSKTTSNSLASSLSSLPSSSGGRDRIDSINSSVNSSVSVYKSIIRKLQEELRIDAANDLTEIRSLDDATLLLEEGPEIVTSNAMKYMPNLLSAVNAATLLSSPTEAAPSSPYV